MSDNHFVPSEVPESPGGENANESERPLPRGAVLPDYSKLIGQSVLPDIAKLIRDVSAMPDFSRALRQVVAPPRIADSILSSIRVPLVPSAAGYRTATDALLRSIGFDHESELPNLGVRPTSDDTAFRVIAQASPDTAAAIALVECLQNK